MRGRWYHVYRRDQDVTVGSERFACGPDGALSPEPKNEDTVRRLAQSKNYRFVSDEPEKTSELEPNAESEQKPKGLGLRGRRPGIRTDEEPAAE